MFGTKTNFSLSSFTAPQSNNSDVIKVHIPDFKACFYNLEYLAVHQEERSCDK